jgi:hypothetical protein
MLIQWRLQVRSTIGLWNMSMATCRPMRISSQRLVVSQQACVGAVL